MPKTNYTHIAVVMDRSGSMAGIANDMSSGLRSYVERQKQLEGDATITFARFDTQYDIIYDFAPLSQATDFALEPRGGTALLDAMGQTMESVREHIVGMNEAERPSKVVFIFITDGEENSSHNYRKERIVQMIADLRNVNEAGQDQPDANGVSWEFVFLGANQDAIAEGSSYGIRANSSMTYVASAGGANAMFDSLNRTTASYRSKGASNLNFEQADYKAQEDLDPNANNQSNQKRSVNTRGFPAVPYVTDLADKDQK